MKKEENVSQGERQSLHTEPEIIQTLKWKEKDFKCL